MLAATLLSSPNVPLLWRLWLLQALLLALLSPAFTFWSLAIFALLLLAKLPQLIYQRSVWSLQLCNLMAVIIVAALLLFARDIGVLHLMIHLLLLAAVLRLLGFRHNDYADVQQLLWVHYFLFASCFILHQSFGMAVLIFAALLLQLNAHYVAFSAPGSQTPIKKMLKIALVFIPFWLILFLVFPRIAPLWTLPGAKVAATGLADELNPGSIERLVETDQLAFRVEFNGRKPTAGELYWRARIYDVFDGQSWRKGQNKDQADFSRMKYDAAKKLNYKVIAEPHQQRHLFSLGVPVSFIYPQRTDTDAMLSSRIVLTQRTSFELQSVLTPVPVVPDQHQEVNLQLPAGNPKSVQLAAQLAAQYPQADKLVLAIGGYLKEGGFRYSLTPPSLTGDQIDMFLWQSKTGFCSHYAQATTFLLRAAGVPARIVGGYLGGEWRDNRSYLEVSQRAAHAWVEYQHNGAWHMFDPTLQVAPQRLFSSLEDLLSATDLLRLQGNWLANAGFGRQLLQQLEDLDYYWSRWVLGFDSDQQASFLSSLKFRLQELAALNWWLFAQTFLAVLGVCAAFWWLYSRFSRAPVTTSAWLVTQLNPYKRKRPEQTVLQYLATFVVGSEQQQAVAKQLYDNYQKLVFNNQSDLLPELRQQVRQLQKLLKRQSYSCADAPLVHNKTV